MTQHKCTWLVLGLPVALENESGSVEGVGNGEISGEEDGDGQVQRVSTNNPTSALLQLVNNSTPLNWCPHPQIGPQIGPHYSTPSPFTSH